MMADAMDNGEFWLPSEFLTGDDTLTGKENLNKIFPKTVFEANYSFPTEFPYDFVSYGSSSALSSPVESVVGSTETESDEEDLLAGLTRQLARSALEEEIRKITSAPPNLKKSWVLSGSPKSPLTTVGSWSRRSAVSSSGSSNGPSQVPSPPTTPLGGGNGDWDLIYLAAGQVARLKMNGEGPPKGSGFLKPPPSLIPVHHPSPPVKNINTGFYATQCLSHNLTQTNHFELEHARQDQMLKQQCPSIWGRPNREGLFSQQNQFQHQLMSQNRGGRLLGGGGFESNGRYARPLGLPQSEWPPLPVQHQNHQNQPPQHGGPATRPAFLGGSGVKRECAGTGVFLPRRYGPYGNPSAESRKKPGCSTALLPTRVVHALNKNFDDMTAQAHAQAQAQARFSGSLISDYDVLVARRNALLTQQKRSSCPEVVMNHEMLLPQEWTY